ncbi:hypothetical protein WJX79_010885 [Trebouxia sp. C0005]
MQQHDIAGVSGCPIPVKQANYVKRAPSSLLQQSALVVYACLPGAASVWCWTIAVGSFATLLHFFTVLADKLQATSCNEEAMTLDPNDQAHRLGCKVGTMAASLLHAANHKATNDLALWLYIYHYEGLTATSYALMFLAILSNHPGRWHRSFAYNAANYYIGLKYLLTTCRRTQPAAPSIAALVASTQFLCSMAPEEDLSKFELFCFSSMQTWTEIAHVGLILKLANDISAGLGLDFWATVLGFQRTSFHGLFLAVYHYTTNPACWRSLAWHGVCAIIPNPSDNLSWPHSTGAIWALYYATSAYGGILARMRMGPSHSKSGVSDSIRKAVADSEELKRSTLLQLFASPHGRMGESPPNTEESTDHSDVPGVPHVLWAQAPVSVNDVLRYIFEDMLWSCAQHSDVDKQPHLLKAHRAGPSKPVSKEPSAKPGRAGAKGRKASAGPKRAQPGAPAKKPSQVAVQAHAGIESNHALAVLHQAEAGAETSTVIDQAQPEAVGNKRPALLDRAQAGANANTHLRLPDQAHSDSTWPVRNKRARKQLRKASQAAAADETPHDRDDEPEADAAADLFDIPEVAEGANEHAKDGLETADFTNVRHTRGKHIKGLIGRPPAAVVPVKDPDAPLPGPKARKGGTRRTAVEAAVNAAISDAVIDGDRVEEAIPAKPCPGLTEHTPKPVYNAEEAGEQGQEFGPDPKGIAESPETVDPDFPEPIKSKTVVVQPESDAVLESLPLLSSNAVKQYNENCASDACIICWNADRGIICLPCGHRATCKNCTEKLIEREGKDAECPVCCTKMEGYVTKVSAH